MSHIDGDDLALFALGSLEPTAAQQQHLAACAVCSRELASLRRVVDVGRQSQGVALESPSPEVWSRVQGAVSESRPRVSLGSESADPARSARRAPRERRLRLRVWLPVTAAIAVAAAVIGFVAEPVLRPVPSASSTVIETATLRALPDWKGASGTASLARSADGRLTLTIRMSPGDAHPATVAGPLREVWLMRPDGSRLLGVGYLTSGTGSFAVPTDIDTSAFRLVDISAQSADAGPAHSGQSIMRGSLAAVRS